MRWRKTLLRVRLVSEREEKPRKELIRAAVLQAKVLGSLSVEEKGENIVRKAA